MNWKDELAREILSTPSSKLTLGWFRERQVKYPSLWVRTTDAKSSIVVINFGEKGPWSKPKEWAMNHRQHIFEQYCSSRERMLAIFGDNEDSLQKFAPELALTKAVGDDLTKVLELSTKGAKATPEYQTIEGKLQESEKWKKSYRKSLQLSMLLTRVAVGTGANSYDLRSALASYLDGEEIVKFWRDGGSYLGSIPDELQKMYDELIKRKSL